LPQSHREHRGFIRLPLHGPRKRREWCCVWI